MLYSIFNEHKLTLEFGESLTWESNPELGRAEFKKNVSRAKHPRLTSEDAILSYGFLQPCIFSIFKTQGTSAFCFENGGDDGNRTHDPLLAGQVLSQLSYTPILGRSVPEN